MITLRGAYLRILLVFLFSTILSQAQQTIGVPSRAASEPRTMAKRTETATGTPPKHCWLAPTRGACMKFGGDQNANINTFFGTATNYSFLNQVRSIYNGASNSTTVSANLASLNFSNGMQITSGTNIQAGSSGSNGASTGAIPTLSATSAGQAAQNVLYGGTVFGAAVYPLVATGVSNLGSAGGWGTLIDFVGKEGVDIQNFKSGTSTNITAPDSHASAQIEGYLQYNSINLAAGTSNYAGSVFVGGSYGYSYTARGYARDYGFGRNVNNGIGQVSAGILISGVAKIAVSRAFGPSQTFTDSTTGAVRTVNNFKAWSFAISYQSPPPSK